MNVEKHSIHPHSSQNGWLKKATRHLPLAIGLVGFTFLLIYTLFFNHSISCYDEDYYMPNVPLLHELGLSKEFLLKMQGPAGPLHAVIHWVLEPVTLLQIKSVRLVNIIFLLLIVVLLGSILKRLHPGNKVASLLLLTIPITFPAAGMALTEIPAMLFFTLSLWLLLGHCEGKLNPKTTLLACVAGGLSMSLAILGRQPYLLTLGVLVFAPFLLPGRNLKWGVALYALTSIVLPSIVFSIWGGIVPDNGGLIATKGGLAPQHVIFGLGYSLVMMMFVAFRFCIRPGPKMLCAYLLLFIALLPVARAMGFSITPMSTISSRLLPNALLPYYGIMMFSAISLMGIYFLHSLLARTWEHKTELPYLLSALMLLAIVVSCMTVTHQFSSRYVFQAAPLFVIIGSYHYDKKDWVSAALNVAGLAAGMSSLASYC